MDSSENILDQAWGLISEKFSRLEPRRRISTRLHRERDQETNKVRRFTTRHGRKVSSAVYDFLADEADAHSLDISRLVQLVGLGKIRIRRRPFPDDRPPRKKLVQMTITTDQELQFHNMIQTHKSPDSPLAFAISVVAGKIIVNPAAPVLLTTEEERILGKLECARQLAEDCFPPPNVQPELERAYVAVRRRIEDHGLQPMDIRKGDEFATLIAQLTDEIKLAIYQPGIDELWRRAVGLLEEFGAPTKGAR